MQITEFCTLSLICPLKYFIYYIYMFHPKYKSKSTIVLYYFTIFELLDFKINVNSIISLVKGGKKIDNNNTKFSHSSFFFQTPLLEMEVGRKLLSSFLSRKRLGDKTSSPVQFLKIFLSFGTDPSLAVVTRVPTLTNGDVGCISFMCICYFYLKQMTT